MLLGLMFWGVLIFSWYLMFKLGKASGVAEGYHKAIKIVETLLSKE